MKAMADCIEVWEGITNSNGSHELLELERLVKNKSPILTPTTSPAQPSPRVAKPVPRVDNKTNENKRITRSIQRTMHGSNRFRGCRCQHPSKERNRSMSEQQLKAKNEENAGGARHRAKTVLPCHQTHHLQTRGTIRR